MRSWFLGARLIDRTRRLFGNNPSVFNLSLLQGTPMHPSILVNSPIPPDKGEIAEVIQLTPHEVQRIKERLIREHAKCWDSPVPPNNVEIAEVR